MRFDIELIHCYAPVFTSNGTNKSMDYCQRLWYMRSQVVKARLKCTSCSCSRETLTQTQTLQNTKNTFIIPSNSEQSHQNLTSYLMTKTLKQLRHSQYPDSSLMRPQVAPRARSSRSRCHKDASVVSAAARIHLVRLLVHQVDLSLHIRL